MATLVWLWVLRTARAIGSQRGQQHLTICPLLPATSHVSATSHARCLFRARGGRSQPGFGAVFGSARPAPRMGPPGHPTAGEGDTVQAPSPSLLLSVCTLPVRG